MGLLLRRRENKKEKRRKYMKTAVVKGDSVTSTSEYLRKNCNFQTESPLYNVLIILYLTWPSVWPSP